jgi:hypothetical protein
MRNLEPRSHSEPPEQNAGNRNKRCFVEPSDHLRNRLNLIMFIGLHLKTFNAVSLKL